LLKGLAFKPDSLLIEKNEYVLLNMYFDNFNDLLQYIKYANKNFIMDDTKCQQINDYNEQLKAMKINIQQTVQTVEKDMNLIMDLAEKTIIPILLNYFQDMFFKDNNILKYFGETIHNLYETIHNTNGENSNEDSGYLVTYLFNGKTKESEFVIFDAENVSKGPISRQKLPTNIPFALHGSFAQGLTFDADAIVRRHKACLTLDSKSLNDMEGGFSGLGLKYLID
jgi:hypothetical protein